MVPPSLLRVPVSPVPRSRRYYEGATTSHPRICGRLLVRFHGPRDPPSFMLACALREERRSLPGQGLCSSGSPSPACSRVDARGISQVFRRSIPCLCSVPGPRSSRRALAITVTSVLPPLSGRRRPRTLADFGANPRASAPAAIRFTLRVAARMQGLLPAGRLAFAGRESNPLDRCERFQFVLTIILLSCSPDAPGSRCAYPGYVAYF